MPELRLGVIALFLSPLVAGAGVAQAQEFEPFAIEVEGGPVWLSRNDVRIPPDTGTEFSIVDLIGSGPSGAFRVEVAFNFNERHGLRAVIAPLQIEGTGKCTTTKQGKDHNETEQYPIVEGSYRIESWEHKNH